MPPPTHKLSRQQRAVLLDVYTRYVAQAALEAQYPHAGTQLPAWGASWYTDTDRSGQASLSRSLRRLEARGLVLRRNQYRGGPRTTHVKLLPDGLALLQATGAVGPEVPEAVHQAVATTLAELDARAAALMATLGPRGHATRNG